MNTKEQLIQKLFANQCTKEELTLLFELIQKDDGSTPEVMTVLMDQMEAVPDLNEDVSDRILDNIFNQTDDLASTPTKQTLRTTTPLRWMGRAAAVLMIGIAGWLISQQISPSELMAQTGFDEQKEVILPDGSKVTLNGNSTLNYFTDWSIGETRIVKLQGEAHFEVDNKEDNKTKFQVLTQDMTVEVLGTVFNVNTRQETTKIFLEEGKVKLNLEDKKSTELVLKPGEVVSYSAKRKSLLSPHKIDNEQVSWKDGYLTFKSAELEEILERLSATSNVEFQIEPAGLENRKFTLTLPTNNIDQTMKLLSKTTNTIITKSGEKYFFSAK